MFLKIVASILLTFMLAVTILGDFQGKVNRKGAITFSLIIAVIAAAIWF